MRSVIARVCGYGLGLSLIAGVVVANLGAQVAQGAAPTPEIDGGTLATGLALASGVVLILRSRRRTK